MPAKPTKPIIKILPLWIRLRKWWETNPTAFGNGLSSLTKEQDEMMYEFAKKALFRNSVAEILKAHPELKELIRVDDDRMCMYDLYEHLSWKLNKREEPPEDVKIIGRTRRPIGRLI